jgi:serine/threonine protein kinase
MPNPCPSEEDVACFVEGRAHSSTSQRILAHLDGCSQCRVLLASSLGAGETSRTADVAGRVPRTFRVGSVVGARYRIDRFISEGGMGEVYAAWDLELDETVALKTLACTSLDHAGLAVRIRAEVQMARRVSHPNVCRILEFGLHRQHYRGQEEAIPFFTMDFLTGETLAAHVARRGRLTDLEAAAIGSEVLDGLAAIHAAGIVHRDLKPENVFLVSSAAGESRAVIMDFGLARLTDVQASLTSSTGSAPLGTPAYMAPEQALGGTPSTTWDIYAFGAVLFRLMAGELPFKANTSAALARLHQVAPRLSSVVAGVNPTIEAIVARCLERDPTRRFASAGDLRRALSAIHRPARRRRMRPLLLNLLPLVLLGVGLATLLGNRGGQAGAAARSREDESPPPHGTPLRVPVGPGSARDTVPVPANAPTASATGQCARETCGDVTRHQHAMRVRNVGHASRRLDAPAGRAGVSARVHPAGPAEPPHPARSERHMDGSAQCFPGGIGCGNVHRDRPGVRLATPYETTLGCRVLRVPGDSASARVAFGPPLTISVVSRCPGTDELSELEQTAAADEPLVDAAVVFCARLDRVMQGARE